MDETGHKFLGQTATGLIIGIYTFIHTPDASSVFTMILQKN